MLYLSVSAQLGSPESWVEWISNVKVMMSARLVFRLRNSVAVTLKPPLPGWPSGEGLIEATSNSIFVSSGSGQFPAKYLRESGPEARQATLRAIRAVSSQTSSSRESTLLQQVICVNTILRSLDFRCAKYFFLRRLTPGSPGSSGSAPRERSFGSRRDVRFGRLYDLQSRAV